MPPLLRPTDLHPFTRLDVPTLLADRAQRRRDHPFIVWEPFEGTSQTWTYGQFHAAVGRIAGGLARASWARDNAAALAALPWGRVFDRGAPEQLPEIVAILMDKGYSAADLAKILGGNHLRVAEACWR